MKQADRDYEDYKVNMAKRKRKQEEIKAYNQTQIECKICNIKIRRDGMKTHQKTKKHLQAMNK